MLNNLEAALRRLKPERQAGSFPRRPDEALPFAGTVEAPTTPLLLDTTVYVDMLEGALPLAVKDLLRRRTLVHHVCVLAELTHNFGRPDPDHPGTRAALARLASAIALIPPHRVEGTGSPQVMMEAGVLCGLMFRIGGHAKGQELRVLNDATLYLHALHRGYTVLTRNIGDFDLMNRLVPSGRMLLYRQS